MIIICIHEIVGEFDDGTIHYTRERVGVHV